MAALPNPERLHHATLKALGLTGRTLTRVGEVISEALDATGRDGQPDHSVRVSAATLAARLLIPRSNHAASGPLRVEVTMPQWLRSIRQASSTRIAPSTDPLSHGGHS